MRNSYFGKIAIAAIIWVGLAAIPATAQSYNPESDFTFARTVGNTAVIITGYTGTSKSVYIPPRINKLPVVGIGFGAFHDKGLTRVTIPNTVTTIGVWAFYDNELISVTLPTSVTTIGAEAFANNRLARVIIPNSVTTIGTEAFANNQLISVTIPSGVTAIGIEAFAGNRLTSVTIPISVTTIGAGAFYGNQLTRVTIPNTVTKIGGEAFAKNHLRRVTIGRGTSLGSSYLGASYVHAFSNNFDNIYKESHRRAGTYVLINDHWTIADKE